MSVHPTELLLIDAGVPDFPSAAPGLEVHHLSPGGDGLAQIAGLLDGRRDIGALHIVSHGAPAELHLGGGRLRADDLVAGAGDLARIGQALRPGGDILIYGCEVGAGERGAAFVEALAAATGANVAASTTLTGAARLGGDWTLARTAGQPTTPARAFAAFDGVLVPSIEVTIDIADPDLTTGETTTVTFTFNTEVYFFDLFDLGVTNATFSDLTTNDNIVWTATLTPDPGIQAAVNSLTIDLTGVEDAASVSGSGGESATFSIDTAPAPSSGEPEAPPPVLIPIYPVQLATPGPDSVVGGADADHILAGGGDDHVTGGDGGDTLEGAEGDDVLQGNAGADSLSGGDGEDWMYGGRDNDVLHGGAGEDFLFGDLGDDVLFGGDDRDWLMGGSGDDLLHGNAGADDMFGGDGDDWMYGGKGDDVMHAGDGADRVIGDLGDDFVTGDGGDDIIAGGQGDDYLSGDAGADLVDGGDGDDQVFGGDGADTLSGGDGQDIVRGGDGDDVIHGGAGADYLRGGAGADTFVLNRDSDTDVIYDFSRAEGDRILFEAGMTYTVSQSDVNVVIEAAGGARIILADFNLSQLTDGWFVMG